jgi:uncharacterized protein YkwD
MRFRRATALAVGLTTLGSTTPASAEAASPKHDRMEQKVAGWLNLIRIQHGVRPLRSSGRLAGAAHAKSGEIAATGNFAHGDVRGRVSRYVRARTIGETIAYVPTSRRRKAVTVVGAWMQSPSHRSTLLSGSFARVGVGRRLGYVGGRRAIIFTVDLASAR